MSDAPITAAQMFEFFQAGAVGTKEFRSWLAKVDPTFADVRDSDVDNEIDRMARQRRDALDALGDGSRLIDRDGQIKEVE